MAGRKKPPEVTLRLSEIETIVMYAYQQALDDADISAGEKRRIQKEKMEESIKFIAHVNMERYLASAKDGKVVTGKG